MASSDSVGDKGCNLQVHLMNETAVKEQGNNWDGLFPCSLLSSNHFMKTSLYIMAY